MVNYQKRTTEVFAALSDPTRALLRQLSVHAESSVASLARPFKISPPAVSRHLRVLERAGLIKRRRAGRVHYIRAEPQGLREAQQWIEQCAQGWQFSFDKLDALLKSQQKGAKP